ncbi:MAG: antitoxin [Chloroflexi bacterium]|nr:antitoxin [Chloroflexota bacterium]
MTKRLQVLLDEDDYQAIKSAAHAQRMTIAEWVRQTLRKAKRTSPKSVEEKLRAIRDAYRHNHPTADIDVMLREIEAGRNARDLH